MRYMMNRLLCGMFWHKWRLVGIPEYEVLPMHVTAYGITCARCDKFKMCLVGKDD